jgi:hypothetical protein
MSKTPRRGVHLFHGDILVANLTATSDSPAEAYFVGGVH